MTAVVGELVPIQPSGTDLQTLVLAFLRGRRSEETRRAYGLDLAMWLEWTAVGNIDPLAARHAHVLLWLTDLQERGEAKSTRARRLAALGSWYKWLIREGLTERNPTTLNPQERPRPDTQSTTTVLSVQEAQALADQADKDGPRSAAIVYVLLYCGLRVGELLAMDLEHLGSDRGHVVLTVIGKGDKRRTVALPPSVAGRIDVYRATRTDTAPLPALPGQVRVTGQAVFITATGRRVRRNQVWVLLRRLAAQAGLPPEVVRRLAPHSMRHTYATTLLDAGVPVRDVQYSMGHEDTRTTERYDHSSLDPDRSPSYRMAAIMATRRGVPQHPADVSGTLHVRASDPRE